MPQPTIDDLFAQIPSDPSQIIPDQHLRPVFDAILRDTLSPDPSPGSKAAPAPKDTPMDMNDPAAPESGSEAPTGDIPAGGGKGGSLAPEQKEQLAEMMNIPSDAITDTFLTDVAEALGMEAPPTAEAVLELLASDPAMAANLASILGLSAPTTATMG